MAKPPDTVERENRKRKAVSVRSRAEPKAGGKVAKAAKTSVRAARAGPVDSGPATGASAAGAVPTPRRRPARKTFLVAATIQKGDAPTELCVYASVARTPAEALSAVRETLGSDVAVELTGKLSGSMAKALRLKPGEVRRI